MNREAYLSALTAALAPEFEKAGAKLPAKLRLTCGWPSRGALSSKSRRIGECWSAKASSDESVEVFISPCLGTALEAAQTLTHELVHASGRFGHRKEFASLAKAVGLSKPWRATKVTPELKERLNAVIKTLGPYPHAKLDKTLPPYKKDGTRLLKVCCRRCGYTVRVTAKWITFGLPVCPCGQEMEKAS